MKAVFGVAVLWVALLAGGSPAGAAVTGLSDDEALRLGRRIYREGILPSGEPVRAVVQGDIPVNGTMFTCVSCHLRSGLGSSEGAVVTPPTSGARLGTPRPLGDAWKRPGSPAASTSRAWASLRPIHRGGDLRPAYTDATLAKALRAGIDPTGRPLDPVMPRYLLGEQDMAILIHYLWRLSAEHSPGVDRETLYLATVMADDAPVEDRDAVLNVLREYVRSRNAQSRHDLRRARKGPFSRHEVNAGYRKIDLAVWNLTGPRDTWRTQLERYYADRPVFALLGGVSSGSWAPIHHFSEDHALPCLFPQTDQPVVSDHDWYTLYFSKGMYQEGAAVARYLRHDPAVPPGAKVVQVYREGSRGAAAAGGFRETARRLGLPAAEERVIPTGTPSGEAFRERLPGGAVWLLWCASEDLSALGAEVPRDGSGPVRVFLSTTLAGEGARPPVGPLAEVALYTHPRALETEGRVKKKVVATWLRIKDIPITNFPLQAQTYFLVKMVSGMLMDMRSEFYRDYFLDVLDMVIDQTYAVTEYPRLSFGPGQRYASKGCYIVKRTGDGFEPVSGWVIH